jgi:hypothetical protein
VNWITESELPEELRWDGATFWKMTKKEQEKLAQKRKEYALKN